MSCLFYTRTIQLLGFLSFRGTIVSNMGAPKESK
jgi:hypothetical protein